MENALSAVIHTALETVFGTLSCQGAFKLFGKLGQRGSMDQIHECIKNTIISSLKLILACISNFHIMRAWVQVL